jgi:endonuclease YncB( thermonuclease family)
VRRVLCFCHAIAAAAILATAGTACANEVAGQVVAVQDGDTVTILDAAKVQHRIRLAGIDAPEKGQAFGEAAKESLARLVHGKRVDAHCPKRDRYGREVCSIFLGTRDVGLEQVRTGHAWWYRDYAREQTPDDRANYEAAESDARQARRGLWRDPTPQVPSAFRKQQRTRGAAV